MPRDLSPVHPELRQALRRTPKVSLSRWNYRLTRLLLNWLRPPKAPDDVLIEPVSIPGAGAGGRVRLRTYRAKARVAPAPALLWIHGGGYIIGKPAMDDRLMLRIARELGVVVVSVDYRLAPEHPFPGPLDDCYAALRWVHAHTGALGIDPARLAIGGASAGGGLAAALVQLAHDRGEVPVAFQLLVYPMLDDRTSVRPRVEHKELLLWSQESNRFGWEAYLGQRCGRDVTPPYAVAARRDDLSGLPPAWIGVGTLDLFHDEDVAYAQRLRESGVDCELVTVPGAFHGFDATAPQAGVVADFQAAQLAALRRHLRIE